MRRIISTITILLTLVFACKTYKGSVISDVAMPEPREVLLTVSPPPVLTEYEQFPMEIDHVIDDFENGIDRWSTKTSKRSSVTLEEIDLQGEGKIICASYTLFQKRQVGIHPDYMGIKIRKNTRFEAFKGIEFIARASHETRIKVVLYEYNQVTSRIAAQEIWFKEIVLNKKWRHYRISFVDFIPEEYFEQGFIGDQSQQLPNIKEVGFYMDNRKALDENSGKLYFDNLYLF